MLRALVLTAIITIAAPAFAASNDAGDPQPGVAADPTAGNPSPDVTVAGRAAAEDVTVDQVLSTLGALALGVLGLLWVRRHTREL